MNDRASPYEQLFKLFSRRIEKWFLRIIFVLTIAVVCAQTLLSFPSFRDAITHVDHLEGTPYEGGK
jgi:hypothetical protein